MKPSLRNLFLKKLTRERVVPTISASVSSVIFFSIGSGLRPRRNWRAAGARGPGAFRRVEELVDQVCFHSNIPGQEISHKHLSGVASAGPLPIPHILAACCSEPAQ